MVLERSILCLVLTSFSFPFLLLSSSSSHLLVARPLVEALGRSRLFPSFFLCTLTLFHFAGVSGYFPPLFFPLSLAFLGTSSRVFQRVQNLQFQSREFVPISGCTFLLLENLSICLYRYDGLKLLFRSSLSPSRRRFHGLCSFW